VTAQNAPFALRSREFVIHFIVAYHATEYELVVLVAHTADTSDLAHLLSSDFLLGLSQRKSEIIVYQLFLPFVDFTFCPVIFRDLKSRLKLLDSSLRQIVVR
jgi:hypothetical protein